MICCPFVQPPSSRIFFHHKREIPEPAVLAGPYYKRIDVSRSQIRLNAAAPLAPVGSLHISQYIQVSWRTSYYYKPILRTTKWQPLYSSFSAHFIFQRLCFPPLAERIQGNLSWSSLVSTPASATSLPCSANYDQAKVPK
jgi:hypothetical protein